MAAHWVRVCRPVARYDLQGAYRHYQPGDWFQANNQEVRTLFEGGMIDSTDEIIHDIYRSQESGLLVRGSSNAPAGITQYGLEIANADALALPWALTILWRPDSTLTSFGAALGLTRVALRKNDLAWEMAVALKSATKLVQEVGSPEERDKTLAVVGDLRLPVYDTGVVWVRRTPATEEVIQLWQEELATGADELHAFLRVLYTHPVLLCTLPEDWIGQWMWA